MGGRYASGPAEIMERINASIGFDRRLYQQDIAGSMAHCDMLVKRGILTAGDGRAIKRGLGQVRDEIEQGRFEFSTKLEDIHFNVEARLTELIGRPAGACIPRARATTRSPLDVRLWVRDTIDRLEAMLADLQAALIDRAEEYAATIMPGFTHLQTAQPITFGHHLLAYVEMVGRDSQPSDAIARRSTNCRSGRGAGWLTRIRIDPRQTAGRGLRPADGELARRRVGPRLRGRVHRRGVDHRAPVAPLRGGDLAQRAVPIHRPVAFTTGSSIMPQKRNPDAELTRAKVGRIVGAFVALCTRAQGPAADLRQGHARGQGAVVRCGRLLGARRRGAMTGMVRDPRPIPSACAP